jgi:hypothetical protein
MNSIYVRVLPKTGLSKFFRCGIEFDQQWAELSDLDKATTKRLREEQMLEVSDNVPADLASDTPTADAQAAADVEAKAQAKAAADAQAVADAQAAEAAKSNAKK